MPKHSAFKSDPVKANGPRAGSRRVLPDAFLMEAPPPPLTSKPVSVSGSQLTQCKGRGWGQAEW